jgi:hypothetical protein
MTATEVIGWVLFAGAAGCAVRMWWLDQRLQDFRAQGTPRGAYLLVPVRWQRRLYTPEGQPLVDRAWRTMFAMYGLGLLALLFLAAR